jgi:hypothetical protein
MSAQTYAWLLPLAVSTVISLFAYLLKSVIMDSIRDLKDDLKKSAESQGKRIGDLEAAVQVIKAVDETEREFTGRVQR